jgi:hypothetical protein
MWQKSHKCSLEEERKLELRLGPPGEDESYNEKSMKNVKKERDESQPCCTNLTNKSQKRYSFDFLSYIYLLCLWF